MTTIILTDMGAFYAPLCLIETPECLEFEIDRIVFRKSKAQKQHLKHGACAAAP